MAWKSRIFSLAWVGTASFFALELVLLWMYAWKWYERETLQFFATIVGGGFALFAYLKNIEESRDREAGKFIERWNRPDVRSIVNRVRPIVEKTVNSADYARPKYDVSRAADEETQIRGDIITILGFFEEVAIAIEQKQASEGRLEEFFGAVMPYGYNGFKEFILAERKADQEEDYYKPTDRLVARWTK